MKVRLLNSAMMPQEGNYDCNKISHEEFCNEITKAYKEGILVSYIGYEQNIALIKKWTGIDVAYSRAETTLDDGDVMLVMKLKYRVADPRTKGNEVDEKSFEFFKVFYQGAKR